MDFDLIGAKEKRQAQRFPTAYPVAVKRDGSYEAKASSVTRDMSSIGLYFEFNSSMEVGSQVEFVVTLSEAVIGGKSLLFSCRGTVVRVDRIPESNMVGLAVSIDESN